MQQRKENLLQVQKSHILGGGVGGGVCGGAAADQIVVHTISTYVFFLYVL